MPQPKPLHRFSPNFTGRLPQEDLELFRSWGISGNNYYHGNTEDFRLLKFVGISQTKPLHEFSPNFQDMFTPRGSRAD